jgi:oligopeptide/dipeptide ABC transporter ATP-binding protein
MALVGESGCGKSVTSLAILRLIKKPGSIAGGTIRFRPRDQDTFDIAALAEGADQLFQLRGGSISLIHQEPMSALSPVHTIGDQICETILLHQDIGPADAERLAVDLLGKVGIPDPEKRISQYPFELSGGMRQRAVIAIALVCSPEILIADEPTTALDVTIQAQILDLIRDYQRQHGTSALLITHDLGVVAQLADRVAVMYLGRIVEEADVRTIMRSPQHPYTMGLLQSLPSLVSSKRRLSSIAGSVPSLAERPVGCAFHPRCPYAKPGLCDQAPIPELRALGDNHTVACTRAEEIDAEHSAGNE